MRVKYYVFILSITILLGAIISLFSCNPNNQETWKQFRGNNRDGSTIEAEIAEEWSSNGLQSVWKQKIGSSFSEVLVSENKVLSMSSDTLTELEYMVAYDAKNGNELWKTVVDSIYRDSDGWGDGPRSTPAIDNKAIYCLSSFGKLRALSIKNGEILWTVDIAAEYESNAPEWTYTTSPLLIEDVIMLEVGGKDSKGFAGFDKKTGANLWIKGDGKPSYSSPTVAIIDGVKQVIFANDTILRSFDKIGNQLWTYKMPQKSPTATPLFIAPNKFFISVMSGNFMVEVNNNVAAELFSSKSIKNIFSTSCYHDGYIYGFSYDALQCISVIDGELQWEEKGFGFGSLIRVGDKLLALTDKGVLKLVEASPEAYSEKGSFQAIDGKSWTAPSFANGNVYLRNLTEMASYKLDFE